VSEVNNKLAAIPPTGPGDPPRSQCARLAERLIASLDEDAEVEEAWATEVRQRLEAFEKGEIEAVPAQEVLEEARRRIESGE